MMPTGAIGTWGTRTVEIWYQNAPFWDARDQDTVALVTVNVLIMVFIVNKVLPRNYNSGVHFISKFKMMCSPHTTGRTTFNFTSSNLFLPSLPSLIFMKCWYMVFLQPRSLRRRRRKRVRVMYRRNVQLLTTHWTRKRKCRWMNVSGRHHSTI